MRQSYHQCYWWCHLWPAAGLFWRWLRLALSNRGTVPYHFLQRTSLQASWYQNITAETYAVIGTKIQLQKVLSVSSTTTQASRWGARAWESVWCLLNPVYEKLGDVWNDHVGQHLFVKLLSLQGSGFFYNRNIFKVLLGRDRIHQNGEELASLVKRVLNKEREGSGRAQTTVCGQDWKAKWAEWQ